MQRSRNGVAMSRSFLQVGDEVSILTLASSTDMFLQSCADHTNILRLSPEWIKLVADSSVASAQNRARMTAIEFILQPFPFDKV